MKRIILTLGLLALTGSFLSFTASADWDPLDRPIITGAPHINPQVPRPGPYTPRPKPASSSAAGLSVSNTLKGNLQVVYEELESGQTYVFQVSAGDGLFVPEEGEWLVMLKQDGKIVDMEYIVN